MKLKSFKIPATALSLALLGLAMPMSGQAQTAASVTVNAGTTVTSFVPIHVFGNNMAYWISATANDAVSAKVQAAGNYFLRFPGGSSSDDYHWNSTGSFNSSGYWIPNGTTYTPGFQGCMVHRGTTSQSYANPSNIDDNSTATTWMSNVDTDFPDNQWVFMDLTGGNSATTVDAVTIVWGNPYAATFEVQYWDGSDGASPLNAASTADWVTTSAGTVTGTGGTQGVTFNAVTTRYIQILMTSASQPATVSWGATTVMGPAYAIAELYVYNGATQVSKNANTEANQSAVYVSSTDPAPSTVCTTSSPDTPYAPNYYQTSPTGSTDFATYMKEVSSFSPHAIPLITVNFGTGTPAEAASWVHYANVVAAPTYGVSCQYWQIGNETNGVWETGGPMNANDYGRRFMEYYSAMQGEAAADGVPISIVGPVPGSPNPSSNAFDGNTYIQDFLLRLYNNPGGNAVSEVGGIDFHWYPGITSFPAGFTTPAQLSNFAVTLSGWLSNVGLSMNNLPIIMSEYNCDAGTPNSTVQLANGLWLANWLGQYITGFGPTGFSNIWDVMNGGNDATSTTGGDLGYLDNTTTTGYQPHATYWAMQMMATDWAIQGDARAHDLVNTGSSSTSLVAYADARPDNVLSLVLINEAASVTYDTTVNVNGLVPNAAATAWTFNSTNYAWQTTTEPYDANPDTAPTTTTLTNAASSFPVTISPYSINVIQFTNSGIPTNTPTSTATSTFTKTATNTPTVTPTFTPTSSPTLTATPTPTSSPTNTFSPTVTPSPTNTFSPTATYTATLSPTATATNTVCTDGLGNTCTFTLTPTVTNTPTSTDSFTPTLTPTFTLTSTPTNSPTLTFTSSPTSTPTSTGTPTATPGVTLTFVQQVTNSSPSSGQTLVYSLSITVSGSSAGTAAVTDILPADETFLQFTVGDPTGTASAQTVVWNLSSLAPGTYDLGFSAIVANNVVNGTVLTSDGTLDLVTLGTQDSSNAAATVVNFTPTPTLQPSPVVYPNPSYGAPVSVVPPAYTGTADVKIQLFTTAFRKVLERDYASMPYGPVAVAMQDNWGAPLADGLYYAVVTANGHRSILKLLLLR